MIFIDVNDVTTPHVYQTLSVCSWPTWSPLEVRNLSTAKPASVFARCLFYTCDTEPSKPPFYDFMLFIYKNCTR